MMVEMAHSPVNLDNLMNEGIDWPVSKQNTQLSRWTTSGHDRKEETGL